MLCCHPIEHKLFSNLGNQQIGSQRKGGRWPCHLHRCQFAGTPRCPGRARHCRTGPPPSPPRSPLSPCSSPAQETIVDYVASAREEETDRPTTERERTVHAFAPGGSGHMMARHVHRQGHRTPSSRNAAATPAACRHPHVAQNVLAVRMSQLMLCGLYRLYVANTPCASCAFAPSKAARTNMADAMRKRSDTLDCHYIVLSLSLYSD